MEQLRERKEGKKAMYSSFQMEELWLLEVITEQRCWH